MSGSLIKNEQNLIYDVAEWFLQKEPMPNKRLQKLCYYAYAWCIVFLNDTSEDGLQTICPAGFEAWVHGPVCRELYNKYKEYGWNDIPQVKTKQSALPSAVEDVLNKVWSSYSGFTATDLECLTHEEKPWIEARSSTEWDKACSVKLSEQTIFNFYSERLVSGN